MSQNDGGPILDVLYDQALQGRVLPEPIGGTDDDRMDLACVIGQVLPIGEALAAAERILLSQWYSEARAATWDEGYRVGGRHQFESSRYRQSLTVGPEAEPPEPAINPYQPSPDSEPRG